MERRHGVWEEHTQRVEVAAFGVSDWQIWPKVTTRVPVSHLEGREGPLDNALWIAVTPTLVPQHGLLLFGRRVIPPLRCMIQALHGGRVSHPWSSLCGRGSGLLLLAETKIRRTHRVLGRNSSCADPRRSGGGLQKLLTCGQGRALLRCRPRTTANQKSR